MNDKQLARKARNILVFYGQDFGLGGWDFGVNIVGTEETRKGANGDQNQLYSAATLSDPANRHALVLVNRDVNWELEDLEITMLHELVHVAQNKSGLAAVMMDMENILRDGMGNSGRVFLAAHVTRVNEDFIEDVAKTMKLLKERLMR